MVADYLRADFLQELVASYRTVCMHCCSVNEPKPIPLYIRSFVPDGTKERHSFLWILSTSPDHIF